MLVRYLAALTSSFLLAPGCATDPAEKAEPIKAQGQQAGGASKSGGSATASGGGASKTAGDEDDPWLKAATDLAGKVDATALEAATKAATDRADARKSEADGIRQAVYDVAAAFVAVGETPETASLMGDLTRRERDSLASEAQFVGLFLAGVGPDGTRRALDEGVLDSAVVEAARADVESVSSPIRRPAVRDGGTDRYAGLHLSLKYRLASKSVAVESAERSLEDKIKKLDATDDQAPHVVQQAMTALGDALIAFQEEKYASLAQLRRTMAPDDWNPLVEQWSLVDFLGEVGGRLESEKEAKGIASQILQVREEGATGSGGPAMAGSSQPGGGGGMGQGGMSNAGGMMGSGPAMGQSGGPAMGQGGPMMGQGGPMMGQGGPMMGQGGPMGTIIGGQGQGQGQGQAGPRAGTGQAPGGTKR